MVLSAGVKTHESGGTSRDDDGELVALLARLDPISANRAAPSAAEQEGEYGHLAAGIGASLRQHPDAGESELVFLMDELLRLDHAVTLPDARLDQLSQAVPEWRSSHEARA